MRVAYFTDPQVHNYKAFDKNGSRMENCLKVIDDVYKFCIRNGITYILMGGDLVDSQNAVPTVVSNALMTKIDEKVVAHPEIIWLAITGNHDQGSKSIYGNPGASYLTQLAIAFKKNFILIDNDFYALQGSDGIEGIVYGIPYYEHGEHFKMALKDTVEKQYHVDFPAILLIHQTPTGLGNPNIPTDTDVNDPLYDRFDLVLCGHIHAWQKITPKFYLGGAPLHRDLGDEGTEKGFWCFDSEDPAGTITFITRKGRYPEFMTTKGDVTQEVSENNFVIPQIVIEDLGQAEIAEMENFNSGLKPEQLLQNYWEAVENTDKELLTTGLTFIN